VLFVSGYMLWTRRDELRASHAEPDYLFGIPVTLAGIATLTVGRLALMTSVQEASLLVTLAGVVLLLFGRAVLSRLWFPLAYLLLGLPIWDVVITRLQPSSQILSAQFATVFLHGIGIPAFREGVRVVLPNVTMEVMRECSGVNQVLAIVAIALPAAYLLLRRGLLRVVLLGLAVMVAYLSNGVRITLVGFLAYHGLSSGDLRGMHIAEGLAVSILGYLLCSDALPCSRSFSGPRGRPFPSSRRVHPRHLSGAPGSSSDPLSSSFQSAPFPRCSAPLTSVCATTFVSFRPESATGPSIPDQVPPQAGSPPSMTTWLRHIRAQSAMLPSTQPTTI
jgi:exosortase